MQGRFEDLTGRTFGRWKVEARAPNSTSRQACWLCKCRCGTKKIVVASNLLRGWSTSCGCYAKECNSIRPYESLFNALRKSAKSRNKTCTLTYKEFLEFGSVTKCYYCGDFVTWEKTRINNNRWGYNLDRKNSDVGYNRSNCVVCCNVCNRMKRTLTVCEFYVHIKKLAKRLRYGK